MAVYQATLPRQLTSPLPRQGAGTPGKQAHSIKSAVLNRGSRRGQMLSQAYACAALRRHLHTLCGLACCVGDQAFLTPRRLSVVNTSSGSRIRDLAFSQAVLAVRLNRQR